MALLMTQVSGLLSGLGDLRSRLGKALASAQAELPPSSYASLVAALDFLARSEIQQGPAEAIADYNRAQALFKAQEQVCVDSNPAYCAKKNVEVFASIFRNESSRVLDSIRRLGKRAGSSVGGWGWQNYALLGLGLVGAYVVMRGVSKGARAAGAAGAAGARAARGVIRA